MRDDDDDFEDDFGFDPAADPPERPFYYATRPYDGLGRHEGIPVPLLIFLFVGLALLLKFMVWVC
jgi:hypothetical protein